MSEDSSFNKNQKKEEERKHAPNLFGSLGEGMLAKENIETLKKASGLTPLGFGIDVRERVLNRGFVGDGFSATEGTENTELLRNSSGLSPLRPFGDNGDLKTDGMIRIEPQMNADVIVLF